MSEYPLTDIEKDIRPEDFPEGSIWNELVKYCGPAPLMILARYKQKGNERLSIRNHSGFVKQASDRAFNTHYETM